MPLYKPNSNPAALAQSAMSGATQAAASQTKQTTVNVKKESNFWDDLYEGAAALNMGARAVGGMVDAAEGAWNMYDKYKLRDAYDNIDKAFGKGGFEAIQNNPDMQDYWHNQALGQFVKDRANNEKGRLEMLKSMDDAADKIYQNWRTEAMSVREAYNSGDMQKFMPMMQQLAANSPLPYRLETDGSGKFKVMFRSDQHGGWTDTGRTMTPQEAFNEVNNVLKGEQMVLRGVDMKLSPANEAFISAAKRSYWGTVIGNAENRIDPKKQIPLYDASGRVAGIGVIQNPVDNYNAGPKLIVFGGNGKQLGMFDGYDGVMRAGLSPFKPGKTKGGAGNGVNSKAYGLIKDLTTVVDPATGEKSIDVEMAAALERGVALGHTPYQYADKLKRDVAVYASDIARNNPQLKPEEVRQRARAKAFAGGGDPQGLRKHGPPAPVRTAPAHASNAAPSKADARIKKAAAGEKPGVLQNLGGEQQVPWYQEAGWGPRKLSDAWQGLKDSFDSKKRGNEIPPGY